MATARKTAKKTSAKKTAKPRRRGAVTIGLSVEQAHTVAHDLGVIINIASSGELASATGAAVVDARGRLRSLMEALRGVKR